MQTDGISRWLKKQMGIRVSVYCLSIWILDLFSVFMFPSPCLCACFHVSTIYDSRSVLGPNLSFNNNTNKKSVLVGCTPPTSAAATRCQYQGVWYHFLPGPMFLSGSLTPGRICHWCCCHAPLPLFPVGRQTPGRRYVTWSIQRMTSP